MLDLSGRVVKARAAELSAAAALEREAEQRLVRARERRLSRLEEFTARLRRGIAPWEWAAYARFLESLQAEEARLAEELSARRARTDACRARLLEDRREQKALEVLRERALAAHRAEEEREERKLLDDLASAWHERGRAAGKRSGLP